MTTWKHCERMIAKLLGDVVLHEKGLQYDESYVIIRLLNFNKEMNDEKNDAT